MSDSKRPPRPKLHLREAIAASHRPVFRNVNLSEVGRLVGISCAHMSKIFSGDRTPRLDTAAAIAAAIGMSLDELYAELISRRQKRRQRAH